MEGRLRLRFAAKLSGSGWWNNDHFTPFSQDDFLKCLMSFTELQSFKCSYNSKTNLWTVEITTRPMTCSGFVREFQRTFEAKYKIHPWVRVEKYQLSKDEMESILTVSCMEKITSE